MRISIVEVLDIVLATTSGEAWGKEEGTTLEPLELHRRTGATTKVLWLGATPKAPLFHVRAPRRGQIAFTRN